MRWGEIGTNVGASTRGHKSGARLALRPRRRYLAQVTADDTIRYQIDRDDRLSAFNAAWQVFASANGSPDLTAANILGRSLWSFLADETTRQIYQRMVESVRAGGAPVRFNFRCDAPDIRRVLAMEITRDAAETVGFRVDLVRDEARPAVALLDSSRPRTEAFVTICGWCKDVLVAPDRWVPVESAVDALGLFERDALPALSHGICPTCEAAMQPR